jgi:BirA family transcriptional regulator, biotin operon repressor / biotin---[acetyl-CoA-carboxylase] ligase
MDDLIGLSSRLEDAIARVGARWVRRVVVVREVASTQDFARDMAKGAPGLVVIAGRQTTGRGRLGRQWADTSHLGLAMTFVLDAAAHTPEKLSIAAGVAACRACEESLAGAEVGLRWPNDVGERDRGGGPGRKLSGALIEAGGGVALVGIGINVLQPQMEWPAGLAGRVTSLRELGSSGDRPAVAERLLIEVDRALSTSSKALAAEWTRRDLLVGRSCAFSNDGTVYRGVVQAIEPTSHIVLRLSSGDLMRLPAMTTSMVHE